MQPLAAQEDERIHPDQILEQVLRPDVLGLDPLVEAIGDEIPRPPDPRVAPRIPGPPTVDRSSAAR